jgi:hypothetical protein
MATIEQATMPYAITALKQHKSLRDKANPALTLKELNAADARVAAVAKLLNSIGTASVHGTGPDDFSKANVAAIAATGLGDDAVRTMFRAESLRTTLRQARADMDAAGRTAADKAAQEHRTAKEQAAARAGRPAAVARRVPGRHPGGRPVRSRRRQPAHVPHPAGDLGREPGRLAAHGRVRDAGQRGRPDRGGRDVRQR